MTGWAPLVFVLAQVAAAQLVASSAERIDSAPFTYQAQLSQSGAPITGEHDMRFTLWRDPDSSDPALRAATPLELQRVAVAAGTFTVELDFGAAAFDGDPLWLAIELRPSDGAPQYLALAPRQRLAGAPYSHATRGLHVDERGNIGIGTRDPGAELSVAGDIETTGSLRFADGSELRSAAQANVAGVYDAADFGIRPGEPNLSQALRDLLIHVHDSGGGTIVFGPGVYRLDERITIPNNNDGDYRRPATQNPIRITGAGALFSGQNGAPIGGTILELWSTGQLAKILTTGDGFLQIDNVTLRSGVVPGTPFLLTTNTALLIRSCAFFGSTPAPNCQEDAIILGGTTNVIGNSFQAPFQGYGTIIEGNYFGQIRRGVFLRSYGNAVVIRDNTWWRTSGGPQGDDSAVAIESLGHDVYEQNAGCFISGNLIECTFYKYAIKLDRTVQFAMIGNNFYDAEHSPYLQAYYVLGANSRSNLIIDGFHAELAAPRQSVIDLSPGRVNTHLTSHPNQISALGASNLKLNYGYTLGIGTDPRPEHPLLIKANSSFGANSAIEIEAGASIDGYATIRSTPGFGQLHGGELQLGAWGSSDRGARLVGRDSTGQARAAVHCNAQSGQVSVVGQLALLQPGGGLRVAEGANATMGLITLNGTTPVIVQTTAVTASTRIFLTVNDATGSSVVGTPYVTERVAGASFSIASTSSGDVSKVAWFLIQPD